MKSVSTFSILFWIKKTRIVNGKVPIYARITINGKRIEISTQKEVSIIEWDARYQISINRTNEAKHLNDDLLLLKSKLLQCHSRLTLRELYITPELLKNEYLGIVEKPRMLLEIFQQHNNEVEKLIGKDYCKTTWIKYVATLKHL